MTHAQCSSYAILGGTVPPYFVNVPLYWVKLHPLYPPPPPLLPIWQIFNDY